MVPIPLLVLFFSLSCVESLWFLVTFREMLLPSSGDVCEICVWYLCVCRGSKYFKVISDWLIADLYGTILVGGPLRTQFDHVVVLAVVFFVLLSKFLAV